MFTFGGSAPQRLLMLQFKPRWEYIDEVREFCRGFVQKTFGDADVGQQLGMVVHELVENAVRYGDQGDLLLRIERSQDSIVVCVANTTTDERAAHLREVIGELSSVPPKEAFQRALRRSVELAPDESGIGLSRVRYEGAAELQLDVAPGRVSLIARFSA